MLSKRRTYHSVSSLGSTCTLNFGSMVLQISISGFSPESNKVINSVASWALLAGEVIRIICDGGVCTVCSATHVA